MYVFRVLSPQDHRILRAVSDMQLPTFPFLHILCPQLIFVDDSLFLMCSYRVFPLLCFVYVVSDYGPTSLSLSSSVIDVIVLLIFGCCDFARVIPRPNAGDAR